MNNTVIQVENLSKQYRLGEVGTGTISHDINRWWAKVRGKEDPFLKIGEANDRATKGNSDYVWALQDINFEVKQGEVLGIIGRNGAGKSTLLKILSKTTTPTTGNIKVKGRIASLLEVGTGFHPEMTGRENIFLNGAILGMTRKEIKSKFDEIVDFSGVERYIDTPVKRYSSGMYVRLAFAVAAHLEPEILIVDEVLAVGDAEFQKKCLGKMKDVSGQGRTVLFVSHNMAAIENLCNNVFLLANGKAHSFGETQTIIRNYLNLNAATNEEGIFTNTDRKGNATIKFTKIVMYDNKTGKEVKDIQSGADVKFRFFFERNVEQLNDVMLAIGINDQHDHRISFLSNEIIDKKIEPTADKNYWDIIINKIPLTVGRYTITVFCTVQREIADWIQNAFTFDISSGNFYNTGKQVSQGSGSVLLNYFIS
ncbi:MAG: ABC transporter ATP-binding protein [Bacteroidetes bacterium]|nr:ABC transporter ATP-binding protein [Bacteroidota bacterium]